jgi:Amt family ammonium transporter
MENLNSGNTAFIILCTALVLLMTPALALFYGGLVRQRDMVSIMMQNFICIGIVSLIWVFGGFSLAFGPDIGGVIGNILPYFAMNHIGAAPNANVAAGIPFIMVFAFQMMFAIITPALITGAVVERFNFLPFIGFVVLWTLFVYIPVAHWVWGGGFLSRWGVVDFAGGLVVHTSAGFAALAAAGYLGVRKVVSTQGDGNPSRLSMVALGAGLLWFGWFGFNAGGAYAADELAAIAFINTMLAGAIAMLVWLVLDWWKTSRPSFTGSLVGGVAGLATITPAAGYVEPTAALVIGAAGAAACYFAKRVQSKLKIDDTLEVWRAHGVGGATGSILVGVLASSSINKVSAGPRQLAIQIAAVVLVACYAYVVTWLIMTLLGRTGMLRPPSDETALGLECVE